MVLNREEAVEWLDRELGYAADRRQAAPRDLQPFIDACVAVATFLESGNVTDGRLELFTTLAMHILNARNKIASPLFTPPAPGKGDKGLSVEQVRLRAWAGCAAAALTAAGGTPTEADVKAARATDWLVDDDGLAGRVGGPLSHTAVQRARSRVNANHADDPLAVFAAGVMEIAALVDETSRGKWLLAQLARGGHAYGF